MRTPSPSADGVVSVTRYVITHPWEVFIECWNWKAAVLSGLFRGVAFAVPMARLTGDGAIRGVFIEMGFRIAIAGFWGSLLQRYRNAQPAWVAGVAVAVVLPAAAHCLEFAALRAGHATHIKTGMVVSVVISIGSLLINLGLMRRDLLITGDHTQSLNADLRCIPGALAAMLAGACDRIKRRPIEWES
jgi:hypothetical protein